MKPAKQVKDLPKVHVKPIGSPAQGVRDIVRKASGQFHGNRDFAGRPVNRTYKVK